MYVCLCTATTDRQIRKAADEGARTLSDLKSRLGVASQCGECECLAQEVLDDRLEELSEPALENNAACAT
jgi:bacterioferritin-associated ferredoxin